MAAGTRPRAPRRVAAAAARTFTARCCSAPERPANARSPRCLPRRYPRRASRYNPRPPAIRFHRTLPCVSVPYGSPNNPRRRADGGRHRRAVPPALQATGGRLRGVGDGRVESRRCADGEIAPPHRPRRRGSPPIAVQIAGADPRRRWRTRRATTSIAARRSSSAWVARRRSATSPRVRRSGRRARVATILEGRHRRSSRTGRRTGATRCATRIAEDRHARWRSGDRAGRVERSLDGQARGVGSVPGQQGRRAVATQCSPPPAPTA